ncbi:HlyD family type I secretion periplasmic adaptor subunit [Actibacterium sp. 188UL27-1]|uniref:HlyD family type I secretion periplasmic adaptor subunit n=1 Tax=Actibacterium sp. 188UL27-1 TaxID=2786961 RepID=UPI001959F34F|nr:HlyD family type I secretion periplasmic adaptor subunit [Actibacterium sp. 188UL27-1]MBM7068649.1 HlyD family type I secretion periplasmic adaptor subunit [Actibacterium sp. 188UL27-1]
MSDVIEPMKITSPTLHATVVFSIAVFIAILVMSFLFQVEVVARGQGRIVPVGRVQVVQPEFAGRITAIHAHNGMSVAQDQILIELDQTEALTELGTIKAEQDRLRIEMARLDTMVRALMGDPLAPSFAEGALADYTIPDELSGHPFAIEQRTLLVAEINDLLASMGQTQARETANLQSEKVTNANIARVAAALEFQRERLRNAEQLLQQGTASRASFLDVQQAFTELERERDVYLRELDQKMSERAALDSERRRIVADLRRTILDRKAEIDARLATLTEEDRAATRRVAAATLKAPVSGIVDQLSVFTVGGIADASAELLRVVPTETRVEIEATFSNQDIGFMDIGQPANIRLDAFPSERFGFVKGEVSDIAADSIELSEGQWGYIARIAPDQTHLTAGTDRYPLRPGMTATIDITTDKRRIISYFFAPIVRTIQDALGER